MKTPQLIRNIHIRQLLLLLLAPIGLYFLFFYVRQSFVSPFLYFVIGLLYFYFVFKDDVQPSGTLPFILSGVFSLFFSTMLVFRKHIVFNGATRARIDSNFFTEVGFLDVIAIIFLTLFLFFFVINIVNYSIKLLSKIDRRNHTAFHFKGKKWIFIFFLFLLVIWGLGYLSFWPGTSMWSDIDAILAHGPIGESFRSPLFYNLIIHFFLEVICDPLTNPNLGFALFTLCQMFSMAIIVTYVLWWAYAVVKMRSGFILTLLAFFSFYPIIGLYSFTIVKDTPYCLFIFLWLPFLYDIVHEKKLCLRNKILYCVLIVGTIIFRNNGKIVVPLLIISIVIIVKNNRKFITIAGAGLFLFVTLISSVISKDVPYRFAEGVGMPLQQIARVLSYDGKVSEEDRDFLFQIKDEEYWVGTDESSYSPMNVDPLKMGNSAIEINSYVINDDFLNNHRIEFVKTYLRVLIKNPKLCIQAWLMNSYGFWAFNTFSDEQAYMVDINTHHYDYSQTPKLPKKLSAPIRGYFSSVSNSFGSAGTYIWLVLFIALILIAAKKARYALLLLPMIFNWLTLMFLTPIAFAFRYVFYYLLIIPIIVLLLPQIVSRPSETEAVQDSTNQV